jgi:uncharacterized membrane protein YcaP (DUF421 family)
MRTVDAFLRALYFAAVLVLSARVLNRATLVSRRPYDFAVNVAFGTLAGTAVLMPGALWRGTAAIAGLTVFAWSLSALSVRYPAVDRVLAGRPVPVVAQGRILEANLRRMRMSERELLGRLREMKIAAVSDVELAEIEPDGHLGVIEARPGPGGEDRGP